MRAREIQTVRLAEDMDSAICGACGSGRYSVMPLNSEQLCLRRCLQCGTGWTYPIPSVAELENQYSQSYYGPENVKFISIMEDIVEWITARRAKWINQQIERHSRVLEIGCGRGLLLSSLSQRGHECHEQEQSRLFAH